MGLAGCVSHLPARSSHHGASAKLVVPARGPQPAEVLRHLPGARGRFSEGNAKGLSLAGGQFAGSCASPGTGEVKMLDGAQSRDDGGPSREPKEKDRIHCVAKPRQEVPQKVEKSSNNRSNLKTCRHLAIAPCWMLDGIAKWRRTCE